MQISVSTNLLRELVIWYQEQIVGVSFFIYQMGISYANLKLSDLSSSIMLHPIGLHTNKINYGIISKFPKDV